MKAKKRRFFVLGKNTPSWFPEELLFWYVEDESIYKVFSDGEKMRSVFTSIYEMINSPNCLKEVSPEELSLLL